MMKLKNPFLFLRQIKKMLSSTKTDTTPTSMTIDNRDIVAQDIANFLEELEYHFIHEPPEGDSNTHFFHLSMSDEHGHSWQCTLRFIESIEFLSVYSIFPFTVPESHFATMLAHITHINFDVLNGNFELNLHNGELRFKTALDLEVTGVNSLIIFYLLKSNFAAISQFFDKLETITQMATPVDSFQQVVDEIIYQEQEKTFFLPSEVKH